MSTNRLRKVLTFLVAAEEYAVDEFHLRQLARLSRLDRLTTPTGRRHLMAVAIGFGLCLLGSTMAVNADRVLGWVGIVPHAVWDCAAYLIHGLGSVPILSHAEPLWEVLTAE